MTIRTDERDRIKGIIEKYQCSPFNGQCYTEEVTFYRDKKTGLYHIVLAPQTVEKFQLFEDDYVNEELLVNRYFTMSLLMIKPTTSDNNYIFFRRK